MGPEETLHTAWIFQDVMHDLCVQGSTVDEARHAFWCAAAGSILLDLEFGRIPLSQKTPEHFRRRWAAALAIGQNSIKLKGAP